MEINLETVAKVLNGFVDDSYNDKVIDHIEFDSRKVTPGALFVPLKGQRDGHDFIPAAEKSGAVATLVEKSHTSDDISIPFIIVDNIQNSIFKLAEFCLKTINPKVIAVTGSNGKTTTKDLVSSILAQKYKVWRTKDNFNNEIGVPYTLISMPKETQILVVEIGIDGFNQMEKLSQLLRPDLAIITMIGEAHIEFFKTRKAIALEKLKIADYMKENGILVINGDEPLLVNNVEQFDVNVRTFGESRKNDIYVFDVKTTSDSSTYRTNLTGNEALKIPLIGKYNIINSLSTILCAKEFEIEDKQIKKGLENLQLTKDRVEWYTGTKNEKILDDVYNSNPTALKVILNVFRDLKISKDEKKIVILGDMLELGSQSREFHASIANDLPSNIFYKIYLYGSEMKALDEKLRPFYQSRVSYFEFDQYQELEQAVKGAVDEKTYVLIKASHGLHLERLVRALVDDK